VTFPAFKAGDSALRGPNGGFDFHTPPPNRSRRKVKENSGPTLCQMRKVQATHSSGFYHAQVNS